MNAAPSPSSAAAHSASHFVAYLNGHSGEHPGARKGAHKGTLLIPVIPVIPLTLAIRRRCFGPGDRPLLR